jgi:hypothetical protein
MHPDPIRYCIDLEFPINYPVDRPHHSYNAKGKHIMRRYSKIGDVREYRYLAHTILNRTEWMVLLYTPNTNTKTADLYDFFEVQYSKHKTGQLGTGR